MRNCYVVKQGVQMVKFKESNNISGTGRGGFTLIELIVVITILAIAAVLAVPMLSSAGDIKLRSAAGMIASDLEYAKNMAISRQKNYMVVFTPSSESYRVCDNEGTVIAHPLKVGSNFIVDFSTNSQLKNVKIVSTDLDSNTVTFDYLGSPYSGSGTDTPLNSGSIVISIKTFNSTIKIEPVTGYISIQ